MRRIASGVFLVLTCVWMLGCSTPPPGPEPTAAVKGVVNLDGGPMSDGEILFSVPGQPPKALKIAAGAFAGEAYLGTNRVEISAFKEGPANPNALSTDAPAKINTIAPKFNYQTTLSAEVAKGGANEFKFDVEGQ